MNRLLFLLEAVIFLFLSLSAHSLQASSAYGFNLQCLIEDGAEYTTEAGYCRNCGRQQLSPLGRSTLFRSDGDRESADQCKSEVYRSLFLNSRCKLQHPILDFMKNNGCNTTCCLPLDPSSNWRMSSQHGSRSHPVHGVTRDHAGMDFGYLRHDGPPMRGVAIRAAMSGRVTFAGSKGGYGNTVEISHGDKYTRYAHMQNCASFQRMSVGQRVRKGQVIGCVGTTGTSTGDHLHFEVRRTRGDIDLNPMNACNFRGLECRQR